MTDMTMTQPADALDITDRALAFAEAVREVISQHLQGDNDELRIAAVNAGLCIVVGDWIHANCSAYGTNEPRAFAQWAHRLRDYLAAREQDRADEQGIEA